MDEWKKNDTVQEAKRQGRVKQDEARKGVLKLI